jgi:hypothetical protein
VLYNGRMRDAPKPLVYSSIWGGGYLSMLSLFFQYLESIFYIRILYIYIVFEIWGKIEK